MRSACISSQQVATMRTMNRPDPFSRYFPSGLYCARDSSHCGDRAQAGDSHFTTVEGGGFPRAMSSLSSDQ